MTENVNVELKSFNKSAMLGQQLLEDIRGGVYKAGSLLPTESELTQRYKVSRPTIRRALDLLTQNQLLVKLPQRGVLVPTQHRPKSAIAQIAFVTVASTAETNQYAQGMRIGMDNDKFTLATYSFPADLTKYQQMIEKVVQLNPAGIILQTVPDEICQINGKLIAESKIPCVTIENYQIPGLACDRVTDSNFENGRKAAQYVVDKGYRDAALITYPTQKVNKPMIDGMRSILEPAGIRLPEDRIFYFEAPHGYMNPPDPYLDAQLGTAELLRQGFKPEVILTGQDYIAVGILRGSPGRRDRVPQEIKLISAMQAVVTGITPMKLTTVNVHRENQGRIAAELLMRRINGYDGSPEIYYVASEMVQGETT